MASCVGLILSRTARLHASSSYSRSSTGMEVTFPAPRTSPTPPPRVGCSWASPADARASAAVTPGSNHTSPVWPATRTESSACSGKACARRRPPGAASSFTPSSGLPPLARASRLSRYACTATSAAYGPGSHSSPRRGWPGPRPVARAAVSAHSSALAAVVACRRSSSRARCPSVRCTHARAPVRRSVIAASSFSRSASGSAAARVASFGEAAFAGADLPVGVTALSFGREAPAYVVEPSARLGGS